jgi:hypothetical protein
MLCALRARALAQKRNLVESTERPINTDVPSGDAGEAGAHCASGPVLARHGISLRFKAGALVLPQLHLPQQPRWQHPQSRHVHISELTFHAVRSAALVGGLLTSRAQNRSIQPASGPASVSALERDAKEAGFTLAQIRKLGDEVRGPSTLFGAYGWCRLTRRVLGGPAQVPRPHGGGQLRCTADGGHKKTVRRHAPMSHAPS